MGMGKVLHFQTEFSIDGLKASSHRLNFLQLALQSLDFLVQRQLLFLCANGLRFPGSLFPIQTEQMSVVFEQCWTMGNGDQS